RFRSLVPGTRAFAEANALLDEVELIILAVPDDAVRQVAGSLHMYGGQAMVHTSGLLGAEALMSAMAAGTQVGAFHPLVAFADTERAVEALKGATVAIEGDPQLADLLARMAEAIGAVPVRLAPGSKTAYHAAAVLAAGGGAARHWQAGPGTIGLPPCSPASPRSTRPVRRRASSGRRRASASAGSASA